MVGISVSDKTCAWKQMLTLFFFSPKMRFRNHQCWKERVSFRICDAKYVRIRSVTQHFSAAGEFKSLFCLGCCPAGTCPRPTKGNGAKLRTVCEQS